MSAASTHWLSTARHSSFTAHRARHVLVLDTSCYFARLRRHFASIADCLLILTHLIDHTLRDLLVLLSCLLLVKAALNASGRRPWALTFSSCGCSICILDHSAFVSSTVNVDENGRRHHYLDVILRQISAADDSNFDWATMTFICDLTTLTSVFALSPLAGVLFDMHVLVSSFVRLLP